MSGGCTDHRNISGGRTCDELRSTGQRLRPIRGLKEILLTDHRLSLWLVTKAGGVFASTSTKTDGLAVKQPLIIADPHHEAEGLTGLSVARRPPQHARVAIDGHPRRAALKLPAQRITVEVARLVVERVQDASARTVHAVLLIVGARFEGGTSTPTR